MPSLVTVDGPCALQGFYAVSSQVTPGPTSCLPARPANPTFYSGGSHPGECMVGASCSNVTWNPVCTSQGLQEAWSCQGSQIWGSSVTGHSILLLSQSGLVPGGACRVTCLSLLAGPLSAGSLTPCSSQHDHHHHAVCWGSPWTGGCSDPRSHIMVPIAD